MYNGIGLATPRGSGTNGHVQRNWALVKPREKDKSYRTETELAALDAASNRQPNKDILDHERKRKIELKCAEFAEILEEQGYKEEAITNKVNNYRSMLMGHDGKMDKAVDQWGRPCVTETHQVAEAQQEKNAKLREAFGISEYFVDGSSFDPDRQAKEQLARSVAIQEKETQKAIEREKEKEVEKQQAAKYDLVHTPSPEPQNNDIKLTKKKKRKSSSSSEEPKKKKKSKKKKKERSGKSKDKKKKKKRRHSSESSEDSDESNSSSEKSESSSEDEKKKKRKKKKEKKKSKKKRQSSSESSRESSPEPLPKKIRTDKSSKSKDKLESKDVKKDSREKVNKQERDHLENRKRRSPSPKRSRKSRSREREQKNANSYRRSHSPRNQSPRENSQQKSRDYSGERKTVRYYDADRQKSDNRSRLGNRSRSPNVRERYRSKSRSPTFKDSRKKSRSHSLDEVRGKSDKRKDRRSRSIDSPKRHRTNSRDRIKKYDSKKEFTSKKEERSKREVSPNRRSIDRKSLSPIRRQKFADKPKEKSIDHNSPIREHKRERYSKSDRNRKSSEKVYSPDLRSRSAEKHKDKIKKRNTSESESRNRSPETKNRSSDRFASGTRRSPHERNSRFSDLRSTSLERKHRSSERRERSVDRKKSGEDKEINFENRKRSRDRLDSFEKRNKSPDGNKTPVKRISSERRNSSPEPKKSLERKDISSYDAYNKKDTFLDLIDLPPENKSRRSRSRSSSNKDKQCSVSRKKSIEIHKSPYRGKRDSSLDESKAHTSRSLSTADRIERSREEIKRKLIQQVARENSPCSTQKQLSESKRSKSSKEKSPKHYLQKKDRSRSREAKSTDRQKYDRSGEFSIEKLNSRTKDLEHVLKSNDFKVKDKISPRNRSPRNSSKHKNRSSSSDSSPGKELERALEKAKVVKMTKDEKKLLKDKTKSRQQMPVVRLRSSSEDETSDGEYDKVDEEREKELRMLRLLKSGLAAKAKESLEKKIPKPNKVILPPTFNFREKEHSPKLPERKHIDPDAFDIKVLPLRRDVEKSMSPLSDLQSKEIGTRMLDSSKKISGDVNEDKACEKSSKHKVSSSRSRSRTKSKSKSKDRKSRSRSTSRSSYSSDHHNAHSRSSSSSTSRSSSRSGSRSRSGSSSNSNSSSRSSSSGSRSRSPSIPRRHGSPSFLDRRRITSRK